MVPETQAAAHRTHPKALNGIQRHSKLMGADTRNAFILSRST
jgi:hypothetical protein